MDCSVIVEVLYFVIEVLLVECSGFMHELFYFFCFRDQFGVSKVLERVFSVVVEFVGKGLKDYQKLGEVYLS